MPDRAIFTIADQQIGLVAYGLSNGANFNDLEQPLYPVVKVTLYFDAEYLING